MRESALRGRETAECRVLQSRPEDTLRVNATNVVERVRVADGRRQIASQVGTHLVGRVAELLELPLELSEAMRPAVQRRSKHDRGRLLTQVALTLAAGGRCVADVALLRNQPSLFGEVSSDAIVWRTFDKVDEVTLDRLRDARAAATSRLLERLDDDEQVSIDVDASLFEVHSEQKEGATPHFKVGFGFHPMFAFVEPAGLPLAGRLWEGRAGANDADDHLTVIDEAIAALPEAWRQGHRAGDDPSLVCRRLQVRADTAGYSHKVIGGLAARNCEFSIGMPANERFDSEVHRLRPGDWRPALTADGRVRRGAQVAQIEAVPDWMPAGTRGDRAPGTATSRCAAEAVGPQRVAPSGHRHQPDRPCRRARTSSPATCPGGEPHQAAQGHRRRPLPVHPLHLERGLARDDADRVAAAGRDPTPAA